jgi:hypothetical protein
MLPVVIAPALAASPAADMIDRTLARSGADVVLVGNSKVSTDLDWDALRGAFPGTRMAPANVFGTTAPVWYAVLKNRVYAQGYAPKRVVFYGPLASLLVVDLPSEVGRAVLAAQLGPDEPLVSAKVFGGQWDETVRERLRRMLLPVCDAERTREHDGGPGTTSPPITDPPPSEGFLPAMLDLARSAERIVVRAPLGPRRRADDEVPADRARAALDVVASAGAAWADLSALHFPDTAFGDGIHMNRAGRRRLTTAMIDVLRAPPGPPAPPPASRLLRVVGGDVEVAAADGGAPGAGCARMFPAMPVGDAAVRAAGFGGVSPLVVSEGGSLLREDPHGGPCSGTWRFEGDAVRVEARRAGDPVVLRAVATKRGDDGETAWWVGPGAKLSVATTPAGREDVTVRVATFGKAEVTLSAGNATARVRHGVASLSDTGIDAIAVTSTGWALVRELRVGSDTLFTSDPLHIDLLHGAAHYAGNPPDLPAPTVPDAHTGTQALLSMPPDVPAEEDIFDASGDGACSPLRLSRDDLGLVAARAGMRIGTRDCSALGDRLDGLRVSLDPARACLNDAHPRWLYPGDHLTLTTPVSVDGDWRLELGGAAFGDGSVRVHVRADGREVLAAEAPLSAFATRPPAWNLRLPRHAHTVDVDVEAGSAWLLLTTAQLIDAKAPEFDWR